MSWSLGIPTAPSEPVVSTADAKAHLRVVGSADDTYIASLVLAATYFVQHYTGRLVYDQTISEYHDEFPVDRVLQLHVYPITGAVVKYFDGVDDDVYADVDTADYYVNARSMPPSVEAKSAWPSADNRQGAVQVQVTGGDTTPLPEIIHAIKIIVGHWYDQPEETSIGIPAAAKALLLQHRLFR